MATEKTTTLEHQGIELDITYYYTEEEPMVMYYADMSGHPGSPAEVEITAIEHNGVDIILLMDENIIEQLENEILENE